MIVLVPPFSEIDGDDATNVTVGAASSSSSVSAAPVTDSALPDAWLFAAVAVTVPSRFASSRVLSTAVMVTVSASVVALAAITISASASTVYSPDTPTTVTVVAALEVVPPLSVAFTSAVPPFSGIEASSSDSVTVGGSSSSVSSTGTGTTRPTPMSFSATPVTDTAAFGASTLLSVAVSVADCSVAVDESELEVSPASMVSVRRFSVVPDGAVSTIVVSSVDAALRLAVMVLVPPFSEIDDADAASVTVGTSSSLLTPDTTKFAMVS